MQSEIRLCVQTIFLSYSWLFLPLMYRICKQTFIDQIFLWKKHSVFCYIYEFGWETTGSGCNDRAKHYRNTCQRDMRLNGKCVWFGFCNGFFRRDTMLFRHRKLIFIIISFVRMCNELWPVGKSIDQRMDSFCTFCKRTHVLM